MNVKKAIIPIAGLGTRFLPLSKAMPKELLPLVDRPAIQYVIEEILAAKMNEIIFVNRPKSKEVLEYFKKSPKLEKILQQRNKNNLLEEVKELTRISEKIIFSSVIQKEPLGDGHAILQTKKLLGNEATAVLFPDDIIDSDVPCVEQLCEIFKTCQKPVVALMKVPREQVTRYGVVAVEKIANRVYKIKKIIEKPSLEEAPSDLVIIGRYIHTPEVFDYLKKAKPSEKGEIILAEVMNRMLEDGKTIYGYEFKGERLDCGDKIGWLKSSIHFALKHPEFGQELKQSLKDEKL
ncbi:UTP--glucose-1-phosphate uridylyltransferase [Candidatus Parcubacteria bacterium]|nr:UTP--glucose-1-phosphate uridylyltransferase [Candidatus Parcubacteria bacterium]